MVNPPWQLIARFCTQHAMRRGALFYSVNEGKLRMFPTSRLGKGKLFVRKSFDKQRLNFPAISSEEAGI